MFKKKIVYRVSTKMHVYINGNHVIFKFSITYTHVRMKGEKKLACTYIQKNKKGSRSDQVAVEIREKV